MRVAPIMTTMSFVLAFGAFYYNIYVLTYLPPGTKLTSDHVHDLMQHFPVVSFSVGVLFGAIADHWLKDHPWVVLAVVFCLAHLTWPIR